MPPAPSSSSTLYLDGGMGRMMKAGESMAEGPGLSQGSPRRHAITERGGDFDERARPASRPRRWGSPDRVGAVRRDGDPGLPPRHPPPRGPAQGRGGGGGAGPAARGPGGGGGPAPQHGRHPRPAGPEGAGLRGGAATPAGRARGGVGRAAHHGGGARAPP